MSARKKLSIIIPVCEMEGRLSNLKHTIMSFNDNRVEIVLVNDIKNDNTSRELHDLAKNKEEIILIEGRYGNPGGARNAGLNVAKGDWIIFADSDDVQHVSRIILDIDRLHDADVIIGNFEICNEKTGKSAQYLTQNDFNRIALKPGIWRFVFKSNAIKGIRFPEISLGEDQVYLSRIYFEKFQISYSTQLYYSYFVGNSNQLTSKKNNIRDLTIALFEIIHQLHSRNSSFNQVLNAKLILSIFKHGSIGQKKVLIFYLIKNLRYLLISTYWLAYVCLRIITEHKK